MKPCQRQQCACLWIDLCHADVRACVLGAQNVLFIHLVYDLVDKSTKFVMEVVKIKNWLV